MSEHKISEHKIEMTAPQSCPKCGTGLVLAFAIPHFVPNPWNPPGEHGPFSHYEIIYYCSEHSRFLKGGKCDYERHMRQ